LTDSLQLDLRPTLNGIPDSLGGRSSEDPAPSASMRILESGLDPARLLVRVLHLLDGLDWCLKHQTISTVVDMRIQDPLYEANPFKSLRAVAESLLLWEVQSASYARLSKFQRTLPKALGLTCLTHCHLLLQSPTHKARRTVDVNNYIQLPCILPLGSKMIKAPGCYEQTV
jgi:hypothetical protein